MIFSKKIIDISRTEIGMAMETKNEQLPMAMVNAAETGGVGTSVCLFEYFTH